MKKFESSMTATSGFTAGFLVPTSGGTTGGVCLQPVRRRRDVDVASRAHTGIAGGLDATSAPLQGPLTSAPPIT